MKLIREPELFLDLDAVRARLGLTMHQPLTETVLDSLVDIPGLLAEIGQLLRTEESTRREFAELLAAVRAALPALDGDHTYQAMTLRTVVGLHLEITSEELRQWSSTAETNRKEALNT
jgi:hypothetical protein